MARFVHLSLSVVALTLLTVGQAAAHAEPERANPGIGATVATATATLEVWFSEDVTSAGTTLAVVAPDDSIADMSDSALDLSDPERKRVTVSLKPGLPDGTYTVQWTSVSAEDGDIDNGSFTFTVGVASPVAGASPVGVASPATVGTHATPVNIASIETQEIDQRGFAIAVGAGLGAAVLIYLFWRLVRPKNPVTD